MAISYYFHDVNGSSVQYTVGKPECSGFLSHTTWHYILVSYMPIMTIFATSVNGWIVGLLLFGNEGRQLLQQSQHVYVLGSAITNVFYVAGGNSIIWIAVFLLPCIDIGVLPCFVMNFFSFSGSYQVMFNVCLICYDRWRLVRLGTAYSHAHEVKRAKWLFCATGAVSVLLYLVPELGVPALTGVWIAPDRVTNDVRCVAFQDQPIEQIGGLNLANLINIVLIVVQWAIILILSSLTSWLLYKNTRLRTLKIGPFPDPTATSGNAMKNAAENVESDQNVTVTTRAKQVKKARQQFRATFIMFGSVLANLTTNGPLAVMLALLQFWPNIISGWWQIEVLICWQASSPALDPFVFALTLPKLRARARKTRFGRAVFDLCGLRKNSADDNTVANLVATVGDATSAHQAVANVSKSTKVQKTTVSRG